MNESGISDKVHSVAGGAPLLNGIVYYLLHTASGLMIITWEDHFRLYSQVFSANN